MEKAKPEPRASVPVISRPLLAFFRRIVRRYFRRQFHAVRLSGAEHLASLSGPLILYANHSSWWDPMVAFLLAAERLPDARHFAPMDADALSRYPILRHLGIFPVEMRTPRGAAQFLRTSQAALASGGVLWITPQGQFVDPRQRPLHFKPGLATLASRVGECTLLPLAIEYTFWDERLPETLLHIGEPIRIHHQSPAEIEPLLVTALESAMDHLQRLALTRNPSSFPERLTTGRAGVGGFYALGLRLRAAIQRKPYQPEHTTFPIPPGRPPQ